MGPLQMQLDLQWRFAASAYLVEKNEYIPPREFSELQGQKPGERVAAWALATWWEKVNCQQTFPTSDIFCMESYAFNKEAAATAERLINTGKLTS